MQSQLRASTLWKSLPGNWDTLHYLESFDSDNTWGIPVIARQGGIPRQLIQWGSLPGLLQVAPASQTAVHFFLDDYRFESLWKNPLRNIDALLHVGCVLSPDFSLWTDMPLAMQLWQVFRNRWLGCRWQSLGLCVIPTISWSEPHDFCYAGVERGSVVAISSVGVLKDKEAHSFFRAGFDKMLEVLQPQAILCYGSLAGLGIGTDIPLVAFSPRWEQKRPQVKRTPTVFPSQAPLPFLELVS